MNNYIYENDFSIPIELCDEIMKMYENDTFRKFEGSTFSGVDKSIKHTTDMLIPHNLNKTEETWYKIENFLYKEIYKNLLIYLKSISNKDAYKKENNHSFDFTILGGNLHFDHFMIQKYKKNSGKYIYHDDFHCDSIKDRYRVITFIWYLNDVDEGGETEFWGDYKIKPTKGKLVFFPACWCFPHRGKMPISNDKYIITGWFYKEGFYKTSIINNTENNGWTFTKSDAEII